MTVMDSSALLAYLFGEPGGDLVRAKLSDEQISCSAANWSEVAQKLRASGADWAATRSLLVNFGVVVEPVTIEDAEAAAELWEANPTFSLADRICLSLGKRLNQGILTADRAWAGYDRVDVIR
jgi:ribonuclease VapC